jgi:hypothetical protein
MTPTLLGRWENRLLLMGLVGAVISLLFGLFYHDLKTPFIVLGYVIVFGFGWDALYQGLLSFRWDHDWPTVFQVLAGILEGAFVWILAHYVGLPGVDPAFRFAQFLPHYTMIWLCVFIISQGPIRVLLPRWRYRGGEWF